jgi:hypothetical protein
MRTPTMVSLVVLNLAGLSFAHAAGSHTHGQATLEGSISGSTITLALRIPLDSLVGFERAPKYEADYTKLREAAKKLRLPDAVFAPNKEAACTLKTVKLSSEVVTPDILGEEPQAASSERRSAEHADLDGEFVFECASPTALRSIDLRIFDAFKRLRSVDARVVTPSAQRAATLSAKKPVFPL